MQSDDFNQEMGALIRSLERKVRLEPGLRNGDLGDALHHLERAIVILVSLHINLRREEL